MIISSVFDLVKSFFVANHVFKRLYVDPIPSMNVLGTFPLGEESLHRGDVTLYVGESYGRVTYDVEEFSLEGLLCRFFGW